MKYKILVIDDEAGIRKNLQEILDDEGYATFSAENGKNAFMLLEQEKPDLVLLDVKLGEENGIEILKKIKKLNPQIEVIMISGHGTIEIAVEATKAGAYDFLEKPLSLERVRLVVKRALQKRRLEEKISELRMRTEEKYILVGESTAVRKIREAILKVASLDSTVLICGESGTGKEIVARKIHFESQRRDGHFVEVNCAAIPSELIESELFGYEKGAFTGAVSSKAGKFEQAEGGTIFLDEIGDMSLATQAKLLRVIEMRKVTRLGGEKTIPLDVI